MKINDSYDLKPLAADELTDYLSQNGNGINVVFSMKLEYLGLLFGGTENVYGYVSYKVPNEFLVQLSQLLNGKFEGNQESSKNAWQIFWNIAYAKSPEYCEECYGELYRAAQHSFNQEYYPSRLLAEVV